MNLFKNSPFHPNPEKKMQELRERYRTSCPEIIRTRLKEDMYRAYEKSRSKEQSTLGKATEMQKIDKSNVTIHHLNLTKQELKSDITTVRVEMKNFSKELKSEMASLRLELKGEMVELRQAVSNMQLQLTNAVELLLQKMDETSAKMRVDIDLQRHYWDLAVDAYAPLNEKSEDHEVRIQKLEASEY